MRRPTASPRMVTGVIVGGMVALVAVVVIIALAVTRWIPAALASAPSTSTTIIAPDLSEARRALAHAGSGPEREAAEYLAAQPTAYWLTPERNPVDVVGGTIATLAEQARDDHAALALVVYGLPGRDCGDHSAGGLPAEDYPEWIGEIAGALASARDVTAIIVLEPDSLALAPECADVGERAALLREAAKTLHGADRWIYLDGGHSAWLSPEKMAALIRSVGAEEWVRGFATNVSNYQATANEFAYARDVAALLDGMHAIVDTSRNGADRALTQWCNPPQQLVGEPSGAFGDDVVDVTLWIKPPGESDGRCSGGPRAGTWWPEAAVELTRAVGHGS